MTAYLLLMLEFVQSLLHQINAHLYTIQLFTYICPPYWHALYYYVHNALLAIRNTMGMQLSMYTITVICYILLHVTSNIIGIIECLLSVALIVV